ncbi:hypothetical protein LCGC14_2523940 [marine sediment metagenome]|uniref:Uncharacterized protein n=1 Tax=marine sediment metagenome TaxID=412755 RepID=A0A0F9DNU4_9ZZZZ
MAKKTPLVLVEWRDSMSLGGGPWHTREVVCKSHPSTIKSAGFLVKRTKKKVIIAGHEADYDGDVAGEMCIPASCIISIKPLRIR